MPQPYYQDDHVTLYHGDNRELLPALGITADLIVTDPPYGIMQRTGSCTWDEWPDDWVALAATVARSMWCFGTARIFLDHYADFIAAGWRMSQDVIWAKTAGTGVQADRFRRAHEHVFHWYQGPWSDIHHETPRVPSNRPKTGTVKRARGGRGDTYTHRPAGTWTDDGLRCQLSVITASAVRARRHPTEKPVPVLDLLIRYGSPEGGLVVDLFAGSGSTLDAARQADRRAIGIEADERYCEAAARRLSQATLPAA
ncbi:DNA-methyltransferase [Kitasatospora sp. NPDC048239]|uniref:DNA-methyltransferase n=1 Tax=Kitasatospora sp. NPDC048239 TaxID=3364046 RepID=UPI0037217D82